jgi:hypothetical protein
VAGSCGHGNEPSGCINGGEFIDQLSVLLASQEELSSVDLVRYENEEGQKLFFLIFF